VKGTLVSDIGVVSVERHLGGERRSNQSEDSHEEKPQGSLHAGENYYTGRAIGGNVNGA
jgi:hypothetical protein